MNVRRGESILRCDVKLGCRGAVSHLSISCTAMAKGFCARQLGGAMRHLHEHALFGYGQANRTV